MFPVAVDLLMAQTREAREGRGATVGYLGALSFARAMVQGGSPPTPRASAPSTVVGRGSYTTTIGCCCVFINCNPQQLESEESNEET